MSLSAIKKYSSVQAKMFLSHPIQSSFLFPNSSLPTLGPPLGTGDLASSFYLLAFPSPPITKSSNCKKVVFLRALLPPSAPCTRGESCLSVAAALEWGVCLLFRRRSKQMVRFRKFFAWLEVGESTALAQWKEDATVLLLTGLNFSSTKHFLLSN